MSQTTNGQRKASDVFNYAEAEKERVDSCCVCEAPMSSARPFCNVDRYGYAVRFVRCSKCATIALNPRPTQQAYDAFYSSGAYRELTPSGHKESSMRYSSLIASKFGDILTQYAGKSAIDVGGGDGQNASFMASHLGLDVTIVDPRLEDGVQGCRIPAEQFEPIESKFDIGFMLHTVDHLSEPLAVLRMLFNCVESLLIIDVIDFATRWKDWGYKGIKIDHPWNFNEFSFESLLTFAGFQPIRKLHFKDMHTFAYACQKTAPRVPALRHANTRRLVNEKLQTKFATNGDH